MSLPPHYEVSLARIANQLRRLRKGRRMTTVEESLRVLEAALERLLEQPLTVTVELVILIHLLSQIESLTSAPDLTSDQRNEKLAEIGGKLLEDSGLLNRDPLLQSAIEEILEPFSQGDLEELFQRLISLQKLRLRILRHFVSANQTTNA